MLKKIKNEIIFHISKILYKYFKLKYFSSVYFDIYVSNRSGKTVLLIVPFRIYAYEKDFEKIVVNSDNRDFFDIDYMIGKLYSYCVARHKNDINNK